MKTAILVFMTITRLAGYAETYKTEVTITPGLTMSTCQKIAKDLNNEHRRIQKTWYVSAWCQEVLE